MGILNPGALSKNSSSSTKSTSKSSSSGSARDRLQTRITDRSSYLSSKQKDYLRGQGYDVSGGTGSNYKKYTPTAASRAKGQADLQASINKNSSNLTDAQKSYLGGKGYDVSPLKTGAESGQDAYSTSADGAITGTSSSAITSDSSDAVNAENSIRTNIDSLVERAGLGGDVDDFIDPLTNLQQQQADLIEDQRDRLADRNREEVQGINEAFDIQRTETETAQGRETGQTSMDIARAGGYLGIAASQQGILQSLVISQRQEIVALEALRQDKIREANNAFEDRDFELAQEAMESARELEKEIFDRKESFLNQQLDILGEERAQLQEKRLSTEFKNKMANDRFEKFMDAGINPSGDDIAMMSQELGISAEELQSMFDAGAATKALMEKNDKTDREIAIGSMLRSIPRDQSHVIDGVRYQGYAELSKDSSSGSSLTATERLAQKKRDKTSELLALLGGDEPITRDEALQLYGADLELGDIDDIYTFHETYGPAGSDERVTENVKADKWDIVYSGTQKQPIILDKEAYKAALQAWQDDTYKDTWYGNEVKGDDALATETTFDGVTYKGRGVLIDKTLYPSPDPADFEIEEFKKKREVTRLGDN